MQERSGETPTHDGPESDERAAQPVEPANDPDGEPTPGEDAGPMGNPEQDEEALRHDQEEEAE